MNYSLKFIVIDDPALHQADKAAQERIKKMLTSSKHRKRNNKKDAIKVTCHNKSEGMN